MTTILAIEDEDYVRDILVDMLEAEGFEVLQAENGVVGCQLAREHQPDLILCDIMMPELDGYGVLTQLNRLQETETIPFIFLSAKADRIDFRVGMDLGADDYLTKPFTRDELLSAVSTRLKKSSSVQQLYAQQLQQAQQSYSTKLQQAENRLRYLLYHDSLTELPNQLALRENFDRIVGESGIDQNGHLDRSGFVPILYVGLDRFARINDELGYELGDRCLKIAAKRLQNCLGEGAMLSRMGGDEFALVPRPVERRADAERQAEAIRDSIGEPFGLDGREIFLTASIGLAFYPRDAKHLDTLLGQSKKAMRYARQQGGNQVRAYTAALLDTSDRLALETDLRYALDRNEFALYYQPQVDLTTGEIVGAEALLRWHHPSRGAVSPGRFVPLAEENGSIVPIGEWVLKTACQQSLSWQEAGLKRVRVAVNLSGRQFDRASASDSFNPDLRQHLTRLFRDLSFDPRDLELELTETILVRNPEASVRMLEGLKAVGVSIAIDDFGTGYSSLGYLQQFPFDILKIDRCFVGGIDRNPTNAAITKASIEMARQIGLKSIAEGVETRAELEFLRQHGCDRMQGYFFSRPLPASEFAELLRQGKRLEFS
ncbi:putative bifunctional diguanylate cyclase/phosphodiesterase [Baaleninema simplex]|uniref:putative bifunctional diguanylate cyclase/phosphodiesterase n=1 Tax=Baaleninema simplex TaxID=2862350 RepID=UPI000344922B|nr:EAL domain-containing response regulator [Baaleninema simplex]